VYVCIEAIRDPDMPLAIFAYHETCVEGVEVAVARGFAPARVFTCGCRVLAPKLYQMFELDST
jgi:hypothetical protein